MLPDRLRERMALLAIYKRHIKRRRTGNRERESKNRLPVFDAEVHNATSHIWAFKRKILGLVLTCKLPGSNNFPLLIDHTSREAFYFRNRLEELNTGRLDPLPDAIINENVFFLRIMADHEVHRTFARSV